MKKYIYITMLICALFLLISMGETLGRESIQIQITAEKTAMIDINEDTNVGYLTEDFIFNTDQPCNEWCYFTWGDREVKLSANDVTYSTKRLKNENINKRFETTETVKLLRETAIFTEPKDDAHVMAYLTANEMVSVISTQGEWLKISFLNQEGYMKKTNILEEQS